MESNIDQFRSDIKAAFSTVIEHVRHEDHLGLYGGVCSIDPPYREIAIDEAAIHRQANANNPLSIQDARREVESEARSPSQKSFQSFIGQVRKHKGQISREALQRFGEITGDYIPVNAPKPHISELVGIELEKVDNTIDQNCMNRTDPESFSSESHRRKLHRMLDECIFKETEKPILGRIKGPAMPSHSYIEKKGLSAASKSLEASSSFVEHASGDIIVPMLTVHVYTATTTSTTYSATTTTTTTTPSDARDKEWYVKKCDTYQRIPSVYQPDRKKTYCPGTKTKGTFHPVGAVWDAPLALILEGFATAMTAHECSGYPSVSVGGCDNFLAVGASFLEADTCSRLLMIGDSGTEAKLKKACEALVAYDWRWKARVAWVTVTGPDNYDLNDLMIESGIEAVKEFIDDKVLRFHDLNAPDKTKSFIRAAQDILLDETKTKYIIDGIFPHAATTVVVGETGSYKSFYMIDAACCIATGKEFHGHKVQQGNVLYIAAEGFRGYRTRVKAWMEDGSMTTAPEGLFLTVGAVDLSDTKKMEELSMFCEEHDITFVVVDTLHRCQGGLEENSAADTGIILQNLGKFFNEKGVAVAIVHHSGYTAGRGRGSSALKAGVDGELILEKLEGGLKVTQTKNKDGELLPQETFVVVKQDTGWFDEKGAVSSLVLKTGLASRIMTLNKRESNIWQRLRLIVPDFTSEQSFTREQAERASFSLIEVKNKGQALTRLLTKLVDYEELNYVEGKYMILK
jgi:hypothetical protein